jgi:hypothetical protein
MNENANVIPQAFLANSHNTKRKYKCLSLKSLLQTLKRFISQLTLLANSPHYMKRKCQQSYPQMKET